MSVVLVATVSPLPDQVDAVREALLAAVPKVHAEPGCRRYVLHEGKGEFVLVEQWESMEAVKAHGQAEALTALGAQLAGKLAAPLDVKRLSPIPAGDDAKGVL